MAIKYYGKKSLRGDDEIFICAGDVETDGLGGKLLMIQWGWFTNVKTSSSPTMINEFFADFLAMPTPAVWFFHFGQYDWRYFLEYLNARDDIETQIGMRSETDIYEIRVRYKGAKEYSIMRDSYAIWSSKLENLAKSFCPEFPKLEIDILNFDPKNEEHIEYAKRDVLILLKGLPRFFSLVREHFGVMPSATAAGTALKGWQYSLDKQIYDCQKFDEKEIFIRQAYYGGLVFLTSTNVFENAETYDINSSYPYAMDKHGVPVGKPHYTTEFEEDYHGIYRVRVKAPENLIVPILPARDEKGHMRWFRGEFETCVTTRELHFAAKNGYEILEVYEGLFWEKTDYPFHDFISKCKSIRTEYKGQAEEGIAKLMQNSLYGKFGSKRERTKMEHVSDLDELDGMMPYDDDGNWYLGKSLDEDMRCMPHWAVFITANARLRLLEAVYEAGVENCLYGDTDSITLKAGCGDKIDVGLEYGQWKLEKTWAKFRAIAPKVYSGILDNGKFLGAAKGLPRKGITDKHWNDLLEDGHTSAHALSLPSLKVAMKRGVKPAFELLRHSSSLQNSSNFVACENGDVRLKYKA